MKLHNLISIQKKSQRIGRGGKRGSYSGRGVKGQKSRSGRVIRPAERDFIIRLPKLRGFRNKPKTGTTKVFNLKEISNNFKGAKAETVISRELLVKSNLLSKNFRGDIKILSVGEISFPITVKGIYVSAEASKKIEKAGGKVIEGK
jgi:large subunit ribosomal protein L15